jgi:hypothetical protein
MCICDLQRCLQIDFDHAEGVQRTALRRRQPSVAAACRLAC